MTWTGVLLALSAGFAFVLATRLGRGRGRPARRTPCGHSWRKSGAALRVDGWDCQPEECGVCGAQRLYAEGPEGAKTVPLDARAAERLAMAVGAEERRALVREALR